MSIKLRLSDSNKEYIEEQIIEQIKNYLKTYDLDCEDCEKCIYFTSKYYPATREEPESYDCDCTFSWKKNEEAATNATVELILNEIKTQSFWDDFYGEEQFEEIMNNDWEPEILEALVSLEISPCVGFEYNYKWDWTQEDYDAEEGDRKYDEWKDNKL